MTRVLVLGGAGMLGHKVFQVLSGSFDLFATFRTPDGLWTRYPVYERVDRGHLLGGVDALHFATVVHALERVRPDVVVNCIGIIQQVKESDDPIITISLNSLLPHRLAEWCAANKARLLHISTDCVFSGRKGNYTEEDVPDAEHLYGRSKLLGELNRPGCLTLRTSIFGRDFLKQSALLEWFLKQRGSRVPGYRNVVYTGFPTQALARIMGDLICDNPDLTGLYQVASQPINKCDLLTRVRDALHLDIEIVPVDEPRHDRSLNGGRFLSATGYRVPGWDEMIAELAADTTPYDDWRKQYATV